MADNTVLNAGAGGDTIGTDDIAGVKYQIVKVAYGAADSVTQVSTSAGLPVQQQGTWVLGANSGVDIGDVTLTANSGVDIGDVDVLSVIAGTGATNLGKAIDAVGGATDTGVAVLAIRDDALAALVPIEGDYVALRTDANGALWVHDDALDAALAGSELQVDIVAALPTGANVIGAVTQSGTWNVTVNTALPAGANAIGTVTAVGAAASGAAKSGNPVQVGGVFNTTQPTVTTGQAVEAQYSARGGAIVATGVDTFNVTVNAALPTGSNVIGALSANQSVNVAQMNGVAVTMGNGISGTGVQRVTIASDSTGQVTLAAGSATIGALTANQSVNVAQMNGVAVTMGNGVSGTGVQRVTLASDSTGQVTLASGATVAVTQATASSLNAQVVGEVANDGVDSGNPQKIGGRAGGTLPTAVADADRVNGWFDRHGAQHVRTGAEGVVPTYSSHVPAANTQATATRAAGAAGVRNVCTSFTAVLAAGATAPTAVNLVVNVIDGASGGTTYLWRGTISLPAVAGSTNGIVNVPCWLVGTAATALTIEFSAAGGANTFESVTMSTIQITE